jgi:CRISPR-associated exonuclease Cas4
MTDAEPLDPIPLSALQHWAYCPRQCALIHLEQAFDNNLHTLRGNALHARVDQPGVLSERGLRVERALPVWHDGLGLIGKADVVEFQSDNTPYPVEYKQGSRHKSAAIVACDELQLAAQALCREAMTGRAVPEGAIFYASSKRRRVVSIDGALRERVVEASAAVQALLASERLPPPLMGELAQARCKSCSLLDRCQPEAGQSTALRQAQAALFDPDAEP